MWDTCPKKFLDMQYIIKPTLATAEKNSLPLELVYMSETKEEMLRNTLKLL